MKQYSTLAVTLFLVLISCSRIEQKVDAGIGKAKAFKESIRKKNDPTSKEIFEKRTGLSLISDQQNLVEIDTYFPSPEGEYSQVFTVTSEQAIIWKNGIPPWNKDKWFTDKIPSTLTSKFKEGESISQNIIYAFNEFCCEDKNLKFHSGQVLIVDLDNQKVLYANWDY